MPVREPSGETFSDLPQPQPQLNALSLEIEDDDTLYTASDKARGKKTTEKQSASKSSRARLQPCDPVPSDLQHQLDIYQDRDLGVRPFTPGRERVDYDRRGANKKYGKEKGRYNGKYKRDKYEYRYGHHRYFDDEYNSKKFRKRSYDHDP